MRRRRVAGFDRAVELLTDPDSAEFAIETVGELWVEVLALYERARRETGLTLFEWVADRARAAEQRRAAGA